MRLLSFSLFLGQREVDLRRPGNHFSGLGFRVLGRPRDKSTHISPFFTILALSAKAASQFHALKPRHPRLCSSAGTGYVRTTDLPDDDDEESEASTVPLQTCILELLSLPSGSMYPLKYILGHYRGAPISWL